MEDARPIPSGEPGDVGNLRGPLIRDARNRMYIGSLPARIRAGKALKN